MPQSVPVVLAIAGAVLLVVAAVGVGFDIGGKVAIPKLSRSDRMLSTVMSVVLIGLGAYLSTISPNPGQQIAQPSPSVPPATTTPQPLAQPSATVQIIAQ